MLHTVVIGIQMLLLATIGFSVAYLFMLSVMAALARFTKKAEPTRGRRFAILIPAHNEELTIMPTIQSLFMVEYPRELFDVFVIADNCTDGTADIAARGGAMVLVRTNNELRGKGYALRWSIDQLLSRDNAHDAFVVVDADSIVSRNFIGIMNTYLERGAKVVQSSDLVKPQPGVWSSEITRLGFALYNFVRPLGRRVIGCSAGLRGNGMCFDANVLRSHPWHAYSRAEDIEFGLYLLLHGVSVTFAPEASVLAIMPQNPQLAESQRARWEGGRLPIIRMYALTLLREGLFRGSLKCLDSFIDLVTPALINLMTMVSGILVLTIAMVLSGFSEMLVFMFLWMIVFVLGIFHMFIGLLAVRADKDLYKALFHLPRYTIWKMLLYMKLARNGETKEWVRTTREPDSQHESSAKL